MEFTLPGHTSELYLLLNADYTVDVLKTDKGEATGEKGTWTLIYDQSVVVTLPDRHKAVYQANLRYSLKPEIQPHQYDGLKAQSYEAFNSRCDETMVGVKFNKDSMIQCWVGYQTQPLTTTKATENSLTSPLILAQTDAETDTDAETELESETHAFGGRLGFFQDMPEEERVALAQTINESGLSWEADPYLETSENADFIGLAQTSSETYKEFNDGTPGFKEALRQA